MIVLIQVVATFVVAGAAISLILMTAADRARPKPLPPPQVQGEFWAQPGPKKLWDDMRPAAAFDTLDRIKAALADEQDRTENALSAAGIHDSLGRAEPRRIDPDAEPARAAGHLFRRRERSVSR